MCRWVGSVLATTITRSLLMPLVMKVFEPLSTYSSPSRIAVEAMLARSEPVPGSVMAIAVMSVPAAMPGSQRAACSALQYSTKYGVVMSLWSVMPSPAPPMPAAASSSASTTLKRKSSLPPPPNSSGTASPRNPNDPAEANTSRGAMPSRSQSA